MARCVYLHIGTMKAATTYLQNLFDANRDLLAGHGLLWQGARFNQYAVHDFRGSGMLPPSEKGAFQEFRDQVRREHGDVIVSMELLARQPAGQVRRLLTELGAENYVVMVTARDVTRAAKSHWQETTQNRGSTPWAQWIADVCAADPGTAESRFWQHHYLPRILDNWDGVAKPGDMKLITIPQPGAEADLVWRRFASVIGIPPEQARQPSFANSGLGAVSAELMRRLNGELADTPFDDYRWGFKAALAKQTLRKRAPLEPTISLDPQQHARLAQVAGDMVEEIRRRGEAIDVVGDLTDLLPPAEPQLPPYDPGRATDSEVLEAAMAGLLGLGRRVSSHHHEVRRLRSELEDMSRANRKLSADLERWSSRPVRQALIDLSNRRPALQHARTGYWKIVAAARRRARPG